MLNRKTGYLLFLAVFSLVSCNKEENRIKEDNVWMNGEMRIRVSEAFAERIRFSADESGRLLSTNVKSLNDAISSMGITKMERTFPDAGRFEERTRKAGLHLWYDVEFDATMSLTKAGGNLSRIDGICEVEYRPKVVRITSELVSIENQLGTSDSPIQTAAMPFNDPLLPDQWHYYNDGGKSGYESGADINLFPAWKQYTTGREDVIVGVVDGGIDYTHEDLADNMWHNPEQSGELVYGYNFATNGYRVTPDNHGTHVAGTIAAVNNNGKGVCGVAGGDAAKGMRGIKLMSCQIFDADKSGDGTKAIKWSADHGAVISQNSWGYEDIDYTPASLKAAVDYFIQYAGLDEHGNQVGPMKGGIVIFAAGNDNREVGYPAEYEKVSAVTSIGGDYKRAYYSNYGPWTDIVAPGGDAKKGILVLSTLPGNNYGKMQGTSMACPHVSGVAALIVSHRGGANFSNIALWDRLMKNARDISRHNPGYYLGVGLVDAHASIAGGSTIPPAVITDLSAKATTNNIQFKLTVPTDPDDGKAAGITVFYSKTPFTSPSSAMSQSFEAGSLNAGEVMEREIGGLEFSTKYYVAAQAYDWAGNQSSLTNVLEVTTKANRAPVITPLNGVETTVKAHQVNYLGFQISDPDNHSLTIQFDGGSAAATEITPEPGKVQVSIVGKDAPAGSYNAKLVVTDAYGLASEVKILYTILKNHAPVMLKQLGDQIFGAKGEKNTVKIADYFKDEDGEILTLQVEYSDKKVCHVSSDDENLYITAMSAGMTVATITATDALGESCLMKLNVLVRDDSREVDIYPNPVVDVVNIRMGTLTDATVSIFNASGMRVYADRLTISPFVPAQIDMTGMSGGAYTVVIKTEGKEIKRNIVKL